MKKIDLIKKAYFSLMDEGAGAVIRKATSYRMTKRVISGELDRDALYAKWIRTKEKKYFSGTDFKSEIAALSSSPKFSVIMLAFETSDDDLKRSIDSILKQYYENWELLIICGEDLTKSLKSDYANDSRIKSISCLEDSRAIMTGAYVTFLSPADTLAQNALFEAVKVLNANAGVKIIFSDEDYIDGKGNRRGVYFKPDYSPDLLLSGNYINNLVIYERELFYSCGGSRGYDLILRASEKAKMIHHIPKVLYHECEKNHNNNDFKRMNDLKALSYACKRRAISGEAAYDASSKTFRVRRDILTKEKVSVIIPFKDGAEMLKECVFSVKGKGGYDNIEIILINNASVSPKTLNLINDLKSDDNVIVIDFNEEFNYSAMNNLAARTARGKYLLFLNNDIKAISDGFIVELLCHAQREDVGAVGAKLLYEDMTIQHAGVILGVGGVAKHAFNFLRYDDGGYFGLASRVRNVSAVTAACMMVRKDIFEEAGGFDEENLKVGLNDIDLCLKLLSAGYVNIYTPYAMLYHYESKSRGGRYDVRELDFMKKKYGDFLQNDPYYNKNLSHKTPYYLTDVL